jgi:hypothetical protein
LAKRATQIFGEGVGVVAADVVEGTRDGLAARVRRGRVLAAAGEATRLAHAVTRGVTTDASAILTTGNAVPFRAVVVDLARLAEGIFVGHQTGSLAIAGAGTLLARRALGCGQRRALSVASAHAHRFTVDRCLTVAERATLAALALTVGLGADRVAGRRRAHAEAARQVAGGAQLGARRFTTHAVDAVARVALGILLARGSQGSVGALSEGARVVCRQ